MVEATDGELVKRAQDGDHQALEALLSRYQPQLLRFGLRMCGNPQDAEDVVQESMLAAVRSLPAYRGEASLSTWLYTIARSFCLKKRRRSKFAPAREESLQDPEGAARTLVANTPTPEDAALGAEMEGALRAAILAIEPGQREILVLRDVEGLSANEVSEVTGLSVSAVKSKLHRARAALRAMLEPVLGEVGHERFPVTAECPTVEELFSKSLEGEVDAALCRAMQTHVDRCPRCKHVSRTLSSVLKTCQATPYPEVPAAVKASVRRAIRHVQAARTDSAS